MHVSPCQDQKVLDITICPNKGNSCPRQQFDAFSISKGKNVLAINLICDGLDGCPKQMILVNRCNLQVKSTPRTGPRALSTSSVHGSIWGGGFWYPEASLRKP